jgi:nucleotide sugar dehydrogenase
MQKTIGFVGQGWLGRHYADHFEDRGFSVVRYSMEPQYIGNKDKVAECDIVFIAVPTPSNEKGFDDSIVRAAVKNVGKGKIAVIKSTILPGTSRSIQAENPDITVLFSPEFLREVSARADVDNPDKNIIGLTKNHPDWERAAEDVLSVLPRAPYERVCSAEEAELTKYGSNIFLFWKVIYTNLFYDLAEKHGAQWDVVRDNISADPRIGRSHMEPVHQVPHLGITGRGAGGHCFIKDFAAFEQHFAEVVQDPEGMRILEALRTKNINLLRASQKDLDLLTSVYGDLDERVENKGA